MKVKLLKKVRARHTMTYNPNNMEYPYKLVIRYNRSGDEFSDCYKNKEMMFAIYRASIIRICNNVYYQVKKPKNLKSVKIINHCEL
jgi:hypothetical protein